MPFIIFSYCYIYLVWTALDSSSVCAVYDAKLQKTNLILLHNLDSDRSRNTFYYSFLYHKSFPK